MSAFIVSDNHIHAIVKFAGIHFERVYYESDRLDLRDRDGCTQLGQILVDANYASVAHRYGGSTTTHTYRYSSPSRTIPPVQMIKALQCLDYQSCEVPDWEGSPACTLIRNLLLMAVRHLPEYEGAKWHIE